MGNNYGRDRVISPEGTIPVSAWKINNDMNVRSGEIKIELNRIQIDNNSFRQICSSCAFDDEKIKAKILYIISQRGKLHNPFTNSGGVVYGKISEVGDKVYLPRGLEIGTQVYCTASLAGMPLAIDEIVEIDYNYGQIICKGNAIAFYISNIKPVPEDLNPSYTLCAINEGEDLYRVDELNRENKFKNVMLIGKDVHSIMLFAETLIRSNHSKCNITAVIDRYPNIGYPEKEVGKLLEPLVDTLFFFDLNDPHSAFGYMLKKDFKSGFMDSVFIIDNLYGAETLAALAVKTNGIIYFGAVKNNSSGAKLVMEGIGKQASIYSSYTTVDDFGTFAIEIARNVLKNLDAVNEFFASHKDLYKIDRGIVEDNKRLENAVGMDKFIYGSEITREMLRSVLNIAGFDCNVIIQGETGVGKEEILSLIHQNSQRRTKPCIRINCSTIQESLAESEFFGYESGAFTGANNRGKQGFFELADGGILFLDEIGTLPMSMQSKLLRVLQENQFYRVGGTRQVNIDVRVICASNIPLKSMVEEGTFREDLYYRLNICTIEIPPLRERKEDIVQLSRHFVENWNSQYEIHKELSSEACAALESYEWPGNVRELENVIHRLIIQTVGDSINKGDVYQILNAEEYNSVLAKVKEEKKRNIQDENVNYYEIMAARERELIEFALAKAGSTRKAAKLIGLPHSTFERKKQKYNL